MLFPIKVIVTIVVAVATAANYVSSVATLDRLWHEHREFGISDSSLFILNIILAFVGTMMCLWHAFHTIERSDSTRWDIYDVGKQSEQCHMSQSDMSCWGWTRIIILTFTLGVATLILTGFYAYGSYPGYYGWNWISFLLNVGAGLNCVLVWHPNTKLKDLSNKR